MNNHFHIGDKGDFKTMNKSGYIYYDDDPGTKIYGNDHQWVYVDKETEQVVRILPRLR
jgi:hypothetical protein